MPEGEAPQLAAGIDDLVYICRASYKFRKQRVLNLTQSTHEYSSNEGLLRLAGKAKLVHLCSVEQPEIKCNG